MIPCYRVMINIQVLPCGNCIVDIKIWPVEPTYDQFCRKSVTAKVLLCNIIKTGKKFCFPISIYHNDGTEMSQVLYFIKTVTVFHLPEQN